jgi:hypothetical protein
MTDDISERRLALGAIAISELREALIDAIYSARDDEARSILERLIALRTEMVDTVDRAGA